MSGTGERKIGSLRDLPRDVAPPRDLWAGIEARIAADKTVVTEAPVRRSGRLRVLAAAAVIVALAVGIWIGRTVLPVPGASPTGPAVPAVTASNVTPGNMTPGNVTPGEAGAFQASFQVDSKYMRQRAELVKGLEARLASLPPESRVKVMASLQTIADSKRALESELGKDPSNALLQELLVNTYQDEMRVLTAVHEAGNTGEGI